MVPDAMPLPMPIKMATANNHVNVPVNGINAIPVANMAIPGTVAYRLPNRSIMNPANGNMDISTAEEIITVQRTSCVVRPTTSSA